MPTKQHITISIDTGLSDQIKAQNKNISDLCNTALHNALNPDSTYSKEMYKFITELQYYKTFIENKKLVEEFNNFKLGIKPVE